MRYQIKELKYSDGRHFFKPQYKYRFWPFWCYYQRSKITVLNMGGRSSSVSYGSLREAITYIDYQKEQVTVNIITHKVN